MLKRIIFIILTVIIGILLLTTEVYADVYTTEQYNKPGPDNKYIDKVRREYAQSDPLQYNYQLGKVEKIVKLWLKKSKNTKIVDIERKNNSLYMYWNKAEGATGYYIYKKYNQGKWNEVAHITSGERLCYIDADYYESYSNLDSFYTVLPYKVINKKVIYGFYDKNGVCFLDTPVIRNLDETSITWNKVKNADGYDIMYRKVNTDKWNVIKSVDKNTNSYEFKRRHMKQDRYYTVRAYRGQNKDKIYSSYEEKITLRHRRYSDCKMLIEGDGTTCGTTSRSYLDITYPSRLGQLLDAYIQVNANVDDTAKILANRISYRQKYFENYDVICIAMGTNDYELGVPIGSVVDSGVDTFYGALIYIVGKIKEQNKDAKVVFITPFYRGRLYSERNVNCNFKKNKSGYTLQDYADAIKAVADVYRYNVYDANIEGAISLNNISYSTRDYVYPVEEYHSRIACDMVDYFIKNKILVNK